MCNLDHKRKAQNLNNFGICWEANLNILAKKSVEMLRVILTYFLVPSQEVCIIPPLVKIVCFYLVNFAILLILNLIPFPVNLRWPWWTCRKFEGMFFSCSGHNLFHSVFTEYCWENEGIFMISYFHFSLIPFSYSQSKQKYLTLHYDHGSILLIAKTLEYFNIWSFLEIAFLIFLNWKRDVF